MIKVRYDRERNTVIVEFEGNVDAEQAKQFFVDLENIRPKPENDFKLLTDFSLVDGMEFNVKSEIEKAMDLFNAQGVTEIIRVIPDPNMDIGFNLMSASHYSKQIKVHTFAVSAGGGGVFGERKDGLALCHGRRKSSALTRFWEPKRRARIGCYAPLLKREELPRHVAREPHCPLKAGCR